MMDLDKRTLIKNLASIGLVALIVSGLNQQLTVPIVASETRCLTVIIVYLYCDIVNYELSVYIVLMPRKRRRINVIHVEYF